MKCRGKGKIRRRDVQKIKGRKDVRKGEEKESRKEKYRREAE